MLNSLTVIKKKTYVYLIILPTTYDKTKPARRTELAQSMQMGCLVPRAGWTL